MSKGKLLMVVRRKDLRPGDTILARYPANWPAERVQGMLSSLEEIFAGYKVQVVGQPNEIELEIMGAKN